MNDYFKTGTLKQLGVGPGDIVEWRGVGRYTVVDDKNVQHENGQWLLNGIDNSGDGFRLISRASDTPKTWSEMTDAEKGALLLDWNDNHARNVQQWNGSEWVGMMTGRFGKSVAYRVKPEPEVDVAEIYLDPSDSVALSDFRFDDATYRITYTTKDGKPDCASIKMEEI